MTAKKVYVAMLCLGLGLATTLSGTAFAAPTTDTSPPVVAFKTAKVAVNSVIVNNPNALVPITMSWTQTDPSGICAESAVLSIEGGSRAIPLATGQTSYTVSQEATGYTYQFDLHVTDCASPANTSVTTDYTRQDLYQESAATYSPGWTNSNCTCWSGGSVRWNNKKGATASYAFTGNSIAIVGDQAPGRGTANVYIDGVLVTHFNGNRPKANMLVVASQTFAVSGSHTIEVVLTSNARVDIDAFLVGSN